MAFAYVRDFIENHSELCNFDGDEGTVFYAQTIPRPGKYFQEWCDIKPGESYAYLVWWPIETNYALDKALKAGNSPRGKILVSARHTQTPVGQCLPEQNLPVGQQRLLLSRLWSMR
ncbi:MAG: hypothetical protein ACLVIY_02770 [Anaerobutyricum soehngenii]